MPVPLSPEQENAWRALARAILVIPRVLESELLEAENLNLAEYSVMMNLSEQPGRALRMNELADRVSLSGSWLGRVVERLSRQGLVDRVKSETDGRGQVAVLTDAGFARLEHAYPIHLAGVREHVMKHLEGLDLVAFADAVANVAAGQGGPPARRPRAIVTAANS
jgi:DNA-binding MarR family transcriptional regulator